MDRSGGWIRRNSIECADAGFPRQSLLVPDCRIAAIESEVASVPEQKQIDKFRDADRGLQTDDNPEGART